MSLETAKKKREWRDRAIAQFAERKAKKAKYESTYLDGPQTKPGNPSTTPNGPQTQLGIPSTTPTTPTPGASPSFADIPMDLEVELGLAEAEERERAAGSQNKERRSEGSKKRKQG